MITRQLTGTVVLPDGTPLTSGTLILTPIAPYPADGDGVLAPVSEEYPIVAGELSGDVIGPAHYAVTLKTDRTIMSFTAHVSDSATGLTFSSLYTSRFTPIEVGKSTEDFVNEALAVYDSDGDGQVERADEADAVAWAGITGKPTTFTPEAHNHDDRYYTEAESDAALGGKADVGHLHDDRYYTESELDALLSGKSDTGHSHPDATTIAAGFLSTADKTKLDGIEPGATADQTATEIVAAFTSEVPVATQAEAEAGTLTDPRQWTPELVAQAIAALGGGGGGGGEEWVPVIMKGPGMVAEWRTETSGSGSVTNQNEDISLNSGSTANSHAGIYCRGRDHNALPGVRIVGSMSAFLNATNSFQIAIGLASNAANAMSSSGWVAQTSYAVLIGEYTGGAYNWRFESKGAAAHSTPIVGYTSGNNIATFDIRVYSDRAELWINGELKVSHVGTHYPHTTEEYHAMVSNLGTATSNANFIRSLNYFHLY